MSVELVDHRLKTPVWRPALAWAITAAVLLATLMPASWLRFLRGGVPGEAGLPRLLFGVVPFDKFVHFALFAALSAAWIGALSPRRSSLALVLAIVVVLSAGTELLQSLPMIGRDGGLADGLADLVGGILAALILGPIRIGMANRSARSS